MRRANASTIDSWPAAGGGLTNNSPRMTSYLLPSSGRRSRSARVHFLALTAMCIVRFSSAFVVRFACASIRPDAEDFVIKTCGVAPNHFALAEHTLGAAAESTRLGSQWSLNPVSIGNQTAFCLLGPAVRRQRLTDEPP